MITLELMSPSGKDDPGIGTLLDLDGQVFVVDAQGFYSVRFSVQRVQPSPERPQGLKYSLTFHGAQGQRLVGFDNAHPIRLSQGHGGRPGGPADHRHQMDDVRPYCFLDAATLLADFWAEVDTYLEQKGVR